MPGLGLHPLVSRSQPHGRLGRHRLSHAWMTPFAAPLLASAQVRDPGARLYAGRCAGVDACCCCDGRGVAACAAWLAAGDWPAGEGAFGPRPPRAPRERFWLSPALAPVHAQGARQAGGLCEAAPHCVRSCRARVLCYAVLCFAVLVLWLVRGYTSSRVGTLALGSVVARALRLLDGC